MKVNHHKKSIKNHLLEMGFQILYVDDFFTTFAKHQPPAKDQTSDIITLNAKALDSTVGHLDIKGSCSIIATTVFDGEQLLLKNSIIKLRRICSFGEITVNHSHLDIDRTNVSKLDLIIEYSRAILGTVNSTNDRLPLGISIRNCQLPAASINTDSSYLSINYLRCYTSDDSSIIFENTFWKNPSELHLGSDQPLRWTKDSTVTNIKNLAGSKMTAASLFDQKNKPYIVAGCWEGPLKDFKRLIASPIDEWPSYNHFLDEDEQNTEVDGKAARQRYKAFIRNVEKCIINNHRAT